MIYRIAIVDDKPTTRNSLSEKLAASGKVTVVFTAVHGKDFTDKLKINPVDVALVDIEMPEMDGIEAVGAASELSPTTKFIMLTVFDDEDKIFEAIRAGACGYLLKDEPLPIILDAIVQAMDQGGAPMSPGIARKVLKLLSSGDPPPSTRTEPKPLISDREMEILKLTVAGLDYKQIAEKLFISPHTVRKHITNIYEKLHVNSKAQAISLAMRKGWA